MAFRNGWLGIDSFGRSTFVVVAEISDNQFESVIARLAGHLFQNYGAPDMLTAAEAARSEAHYTADLSTHPLETMLAIERSFTEEGISERIRVIPNQSEAKHAKVWTIVDDDKENM